MESWSGEIKEFLGLFFSFQILLSSIFFCLQVHPALQSCCLDSLVASSWNQLREGGGGQETYQIMTYWRFCEKTNEFFQLLLTLSFVQVEGHKAHFPHHEAGGKNTWNIEYFRIEKYLGRREKCCWILSTWQLRNIQAGGENVVEYWVLENWEIFRQEGTHKLTLFRFFLALSMDLVRWVR